MTDKDVNFFDLFNPNQPRSEEELQEYRMSICKQCPFLTQRGERCRKCGCFMSLKTTLKGAKCPIGKW
jgi:anaerobic ribonucleoside-triphosphate reductase